MNNVKIIFITYDWILSQYCWIGVISQAFLKSYFEIRNVLPYKSTLDVIWVSISSNNFWYDKNLFDKTELLVKNNGGKICFISNWVSENAFWNEENWDVVSKNAAEEVDNIIIKEWLDKKYLVGSRVLEA